VDNLVVADSTCNSRKTDFLASTRHVEHWRRRSDEDALDQIVITTSWHRDAAVQSAYLSFVPGTGRSAVPPLHPPLDLELAPKALRIQPVTSEQVRRSHFICDRSRERDLPLLAVRHQRDVYFAISVDVQVS
jgi:hypothetical protein